MDNRFLSTDRTSRNHSDTLRVVPILAKEFLELCGKQYRIDRMSGDDAIVKDRPKGPTRFFSQAVGMQYRFQWDPLKAQTNLKKHGISFRKAERIFEDPMTLTLFDEESSLLEERWITLGVTPNGQYLLVVHTVEEYEDNIDVRIISARRATRREIRCYEEGEL